jgi:hypothetical protein
LRSRSMAFSLGVLALAALPAGAANIITRTGTPAGSWLIGATFNPAYVSWNQPAGTAFSGVAVTVTVSSSNGSPASGTAYITNAVGASATAANVIAGPVTVATSSTVPVAVSVPFPSFNLAAGATYFLVIQQGSGNLQWTFANPATETVSSAPPVTSNADGLGAAPATPAYSATFSAVVSPANGILVSITGTPPAGPSAVPALSPFGMGVLGLLLAAGGTILQRRQRGYSNP